MSERVIAYTHRGRLTRGSMWSVVDDKKRLLWVVEDASGELHKVTPRRGAVKAASDGNSYSPSGTHAAAACCCTECSRHRTT